MRWRVAGVTPSCCSDHGSGRARALAAELGGEALESNLAVAQRADLVVLCHKPAQLAEVASEIAVRRQGCCIGARRACRLTALQEAYPGVPVFRLMPNTPVEVKAGRDLLRAGAGRRSRTLKRTFWRCYDGSARSSQVAERLMPAATAVMGVGPAYLSLIAEAQVDAAVRHGLKPALAGRLVADTMAGTAALLHSSRYDTLSGPPRGHLPGGPHRTGLAALERAGVRAAFQDATDAVLDGGRR